MSSRERAKPPIDILYRFGASHHLIANTAGQICFRAGFFPRRRKDFLGRNYSRKLTGSEPFSRSFIRVLAALTSSVFRVRSEARKVKENASDLDPCGRRFPSGSEKRSKGSTDSKNGSFAARISRVISAQESDIGAITAMSREVAGKSARGRTVCGAEAGPTKGAISME